MGSLLGFIQSLSLALSLGLGWKQGFNAFAMQVLTEGWLPQVLSCPTRANPGWWRGPPVSQGRAEAGAAAVGVLLLQAAGGAGQHVLFPCGPALSSCQKKE